MPDSELPDAIGFIGLGRMGSPMARRLADRGVTVRGYDASPEAVAAVSDRVTPVDSASAAAEGMPVVVLMLPGSDAVDSVLDGGVLDVLSHGALLVDMSSSEPLRTRALAERVAERGATLADAPVSGGVRGANAGTLTIMMGGTDEAAATLAPLLAALGRIRHVGGVGAGHALKALNNLMSAAHLLASSEAILAGQRFGLDPALMLEAVNGSSGRSGSTENKWPNHILPEGYDSGFTAGLMVKDIRIALGLAKSAGVPAELAARTVELWDRAVDALGPEADHTEIVRWLRRGISSEGSVR
jgi:3-hydroxyisobutyrate dehydrogenase